MSISSIPSLVLLALALYFLRVAFEPPNAAASVPDRQAAGSRRLIALFPRYSAMVFNPLIYAHLALELYVLFLSSTHHLSPSALPSSICNLSSSKGYDIYPRDQLPIPLMFACLSSIAGGLIRLSCYNALGHMFRWEVSVQKHHKLITNGPYALVRHPSYTGTLLATLGCFGWLLNGHALQGCVIPTAAAYGYEVIVKGYVALAVVYRAVIVTWLLFRTVEEDELMKKEFGQTWEDWVARTPYRFVPYVF